jgi:hypothetical protein
MGRYLSFLIIAVCVCFGCGNKKKPSLTGTDKIEVSDFIESFELIKPPYEIIDSSLNRKQNDSMLISGSVFSQFVPDSVLTILLGKGAKSKIYLGKRVKIETETYLFPKVITANKKAVIVLCFDKGDKFKAWLPLLVQDNNPATTQISGLDKKLSFYKNVSLRKPDDVAADGREVFIYNDDAGKFLLIMTDPLDDRVQEVINPIDTLQKKNKFSTDYLKDKMNIVSIRDHAEAGKLNFFIHIDRNNGECIGELKGVARLTSANTALYKQQGDACSLEFKFSSSSVSVREVEPCGAHRQVKCSFDVSFSRKKEIKPKTTKKPASK